MRTKKGKVKSKTVTLDVVKKVIDGVRVTMIFLQNQTDIHYAMPVRVMNEEAAYYYREWRRAADRHQKEEDLQDAEYISGFAKGEKLISTITIIVYWGRDVWDGPRRLKEMLDVKDYPLELQRFIVDYPIHILEVRNYEHLADFKTDIKYVFGFLQKDTDEKELADYVEQNREAFSKLTESAYNLIGEMSGMRKLKKIKTKVKSEGGYNMCQAIEKMIENGRRDGLRDGLRKGRQQGRREERTNMMLLVLEKMGEVSDDLRKKIYQEKDLDVLGEWFQKAIQAKNLEEFMQEIKKAS